MFDECLILQVLQHNLPSTIHQVCLLPMDFKFQISLVRIISTLLYHLPCLQALLHLDILSGIIQLQGFAGILPPPESTPILAPLIQIQVCLLWCVVVADEVCWLALHREDTPIFKGIQPGIP